MHGNGVVCTLYSSLCNLNSSVILMTNSFLQFLLLIYLSPPYLLFTFSGLLPAVLCHVPELLQNGKVLTDGSGSANLSSNFLNKDVNRDDFHATYNHYPFVNCAKTSFKNYCKSLMGRQIDEWHKQIMTQVEGPFSQTVSVHPEAKFFECYPGTRGWSTSN